MHFACVLDDVVVGQNVAVFVDNEAGSQGSGAFFAFLGDAPES